MSKAGKVMKLGGWAGIGLGAAASGLKVKEICRAGTEETCRKVQFTEAGKFGGSVGGSALGGVAGAIACVGIGLGTAAIGGVVCSVVLVGAGTLAGGVVGEAGGEKIGEIIYREIY